MVYNSYFLKDNKIFLIIICLCSPSKNGGKRGGFLERRELGECRLFFLAQSHHVTRFGAILSRFGLVDRTVVLTS
jgi:hypothetical protein